MVPRKQTYRNEQKRIKRYGFIWIELKNKGNMEMKKVFMNDGDRDYLLDRLEEILHDNHCLEYKDKICDAFSKYITNDNRELKPFNLEAVKADKSVCTRDGKNVRVICFDKVGAYPVVALVQEEGMETCHFYSKDGKCVDCGNEYDLMMLCEKKKGYVNIYSNLIHDTLENADKVRKHINNSNYMYTLEVEWEE